MPRTVETLPYERLESAPLQKGFRLRKGQHVLVLQPFGWHLDGLHLPNQAEHFERESVVQYLRMRVVCDYGPYIAILEETDA